MNMIQEQRESIMSDNNTAQKQLETILSNMNRRIDKLEIRESLFGDVDLSIAGEMGFIMLTQIVFGPGKITSIQNVPDGILSLTCADNMLESIDTLPGSLDTLIIHDNYLQTIDLSYLTRLQTLHISHNRLSVIENLPETIVELLCDHNNLERIDLQGASNLKTLNISNNKITLVENMPSDIVNFNMENTPTIEFRNTDTDVLNETVRGQETSADVRKRQTYIEALDEYFRIKNKYEKDLLSAKRKVFNKAPTKKMAKYALGTVRIPCVKCKRKVGTLFQLKDNKYTALCGDSENPCTLNIQLFRGDISHYEQWLASFKESSHATKEAIIRQKLDSIFSYISDEESVRLFKKELDEYTTESSIYKEMVHFHNNIFNNETQKMIIEKKNGELFRLLEDNHKLLQEFQTTNNSEFLKSAVDLQVNQILPEVRNLRMMKHEIMEVNHNEDSGEYNLFQYPTILSKIDYNIGEPQEIISFIR